MFIIFPCHYAVYMYKIMILQKPLSQFPPNFTLILLLKCDWWFIQMITRHWLSGPYIYSSSKLRTAQMMIFSLVAMIGLEKCWLTSAYLQWLCHSGERAVGLLFFVLFLLFVFVFFFSVEYLLCPHHIPTMISWSVNLSYKIAMISLKGDQCKNLLPGNKPPAAAD